MWYVTSVLCFCPNETISIAFINIPGCVHGILAANYDDIYAKLESEYNKYGGKCTMGSAFGDVQRPYLIELLQDNFIPNLPTEEKWNAQTKREATPMK